MTTSGSSNVLVQHTMNRGLSHGGWSRWCSILQEAVNDHVAWVATTKESERHVPYRGGRSGLPRARALSRAVVVSGVGTTSMAQSRCGSLDSTRVRK